jgi:beta-1,4-mannosyl-glycoprotein beta-1,4-N-acetylglucosaminyltransferase
VKLIDTFLFLNELDLLEARLEYLYNHFDHFVIVESNYTFTGKPKAFVFDENKERFAKYSDKITAVKLTLPKDYDFSSPWNLENYQRNYIDECLGKYADTDIINVSDLDEIPNREKLKEIRNIFESMDAPAIVYPKMMYFYYNLSTRVVNYNINGFDDFEGVWAAPFFTMKSVITHRGANNIRFRTDPYKKGLDEVGSLEELLKFAEETVFNPVHEDVFVEDGGWHLTYFMSEERIKTKLESFAHIEFDTDHYKDAERLKKCIQEKKDLFDREDHILTSVIPEECFTKEFLQCFHKWNIR